nr:MAG TPA: hypothetical protein [Caudoviricetes sp.]
MESRGYNLSFDDLWTFIRLERVYGLKPYKSV